MVHFLHSALPYTRLAFCGLEVEKRIINLEFLRLPKDQRTVHIALAQRKKSLSTLNLTGVVVHDNMSVKVGIMIS